MTASRAAAGAAPGPAPDPAIDPASEPAPIVACTVSRDLGAFEGLIDEMETALGEGWGDLTLREAEAYLEQPEAASLEFIALAVGREDEGALDLVGRIVARAKSRGTAVILVVAELGPAALHALLKLGAHGFVPYPLPQGELGAAIARLPAPGASGAHEAAPAVSATDDRSAVVLPVHGLSGGVGATTFAVNLAWELARLEGGPSVCLLDLDMQFGTVGTYLDLPRREATVELLSEAEGIDSDAFMQALTPFRERLHVLTAPPDMAPLDMLSPEGAAKLIEIARTNFDYVVIDMPRTVTQWTGTVLEWAHLYFVLVELDLRSAENALRLTRAVAAEDLPAQKLRWVLNRAPGRMDVSGRSRLRRLAEGLDVKIEILMPDGGAKVAQACDDGAPLAEAAARNPLRREIAGLAASLHERNLAEDAGAAKAAR